MFIKHKAVMVGKVKLKIFCTVINIKYLVNYNAKFFAVDFFIDNVFKNK